MARFDARLLYPSASRDSPSVSASVSPVAHVGWEDLPSDAEDTFFLSPLEIENLRIEQRRRDMERNREERMRMISSQEQEPRSEADAWGGSDEEPDSTQITLMRRTALQFQASPNSTRLEMRILANYGSDPRFAFLRGRWKRAWDRTKASAISSMSKSSGNALEALTEYGESHMNSDSEQGDVSLINEEPIAVAVDTEEKEKMQRRERLREWSNKRRKIQ
ncbi:hypothetical protein BS47DRAFT_1398470 [Hydnum rufescens UP504]|uniref:Uncharacterized protein n=1 Tax=Hydnum rufescens UP504 TaxID=1448309 RepID=A0A9P6AKV3_9AGAM|nr:hypothetical protein BS47DRAFT_1398470 [Hydnum rufescens UP504]